MSADPLMFKHSTEDLGDVLVISVPSRKKLGFILVLLLCNLTWVLLEFLIIGLFSLFLSREEYWLYLIVWSGVGILVIYPLAWQLFGKEEIQISNQFIRISKVVLGFKRTKEYAANQISGLRLTVFDMYHPRDGIEPGLVSFNYDTRVPGKYSTFAASVDDIEAKQIIAEIQQRFPQYRK